MEDAEARFRAMFEATYPALARFARHRGLSSSDADDLAAGVYEVAWRRLDAVPIDDEALPWLLAVARNLLRNRWRKQLRDRALSERLGPPALAEDRSELPTISWQDIRRALDRLSDDDRELILLIAWDDLAPAQAATVLGLTPGAARIRLHRARDRMGQSLGIERELKRPAETRHKTSETPPAGQLTDD
jgi:RNA polymerase sigma factor (sigma-70 family)